MTAVFDEAALHERVNRRRHIAGEHTEIGLALQHIGQGVAHTVARERAASGQQLVQQTAEGPEVAALVGLVPLRLFGAHIRRRAKQHADTGHRRRRRECRRGREVHPAVRLRLRQLREAEVEHLDRPIRPQLDVCRLQIAMNDPARVCGFEGIRDLLGDRQRLIERDRTTREPL